MTPVSNDSYTSTKRSSGILGKRRHTDQSQSVVHCVLPEMFVHSDHVPSRRTTVIPSFSASVGSGECCASEYANSARSPGDAVLKARTPPGRIFSYQICSRCGASDDESDNREIRLDI